jgi:excisionase family DNA binding protein
MVKKEYLTIPEVAKILGISRIAIYKKVKKGEIKTIKIGRSHAIPKEYLNDILGKTLNEEDKGLIVKAVHKTVKEYGQALKQLGKE